MGRFVVPLPQRSAFDRRPVAAPQQGTTARDVYAALAAANQGVQLARAIAPDASTIGAIGRGLGLMGDDPAKFQASPEAMQWQNIDRDRLQATQAVEAQQAAAVSAESAAVQAVQGQLAKAQQQRVQEQMEQNEQRLATPHPGVQKVQPISEAAGAGVPAWMHQGESEISYLDEGIMRRGPAGKGHMRDAWSDIKNTPPLVPQRRYGPVTELPPDQTQQPDSSGIHMQRQPNAYMPDQPAPQQPAGPTAYEEMKRAALDAERDKSSQLYQKEKAAFEAAPKTASDVILAAKSAIAAGDADAYRTALQAVNKVDVSGMPEKGYGELFSDRGKRQRLVKLLAGMGVPKKSRSTASTPHQLEMEKQGRARNEIARGNLAARKAETTRKTTHQTAMRAAKKELAPIMKRMWKARADKAEVVAKVEKWGLDNNVPKFELDKIKASISNQWDQIKNRKWQRSWDEKGGIEAKKQIKAAGRTTVNIGDRTKRLKADLTVKNAAEAKKKAGEALIKVRGELQKANAVIKRGVPSLAELAKSDFLGDLDDAAKELPKIKAKYNAAKADKAKLIEHQKSWLKVKNSGEWPTTPIPED